MARSTQPHVDMREAGATDVSRRSSALSLLASLRPEQWTKNLIVFAALIFAQRLLDLEAVGLSMAAFAVFCVLSGVVYLVNDLLDRDADRQHPVKQRRPIASGALSPGTAALWAALLGSAAVAAATWLAPAFGLTAAAYLRCSPPTRAG